MGLAFPEGWVSVTWEDNSWTWALLVTLDVGVTYTLVYLKVDILCCCGERCIVLA